MRVSDFDVIIAPRLGGAEAEDWPWRWRANLSTARFVAPADLDQPNREAWIEAIAAAAGAAVRPLLLVGHGLGATAVVDAAEALAGADVRGAFLVTPPDDGALRRLAGLDWAQPKAPLPWRSVVVASRNDPDGAFKAIAALTHAWGAELIDAGLAGRLDAASGHGPWPEGLIRLAGFIKRISDRPN